MSEQVESAYRDHFERLRWFAHRHLGHHHDAEDVVQDAFVLWLERGKEHPEPKRWLYVAVKNRCIGFIRRRKALTYGRVGVKDVEETARQTPDPSDSFKALEDRQQVAEGLAPCTVEQRVSIILKAAGFRSYEVAAMLGVTEQRARQLQMEVRHRALQGPKQALKPCSHDKALTIEVRYRPKNAQGKVEKRIFRCGPCFDAGANRPADWGYEISRRFHMRRRAKVG